MHITARAVQEQFDEARMEFEDLIVQLPDFSVSQSQLGFMRFSAHIPMKSIMSQ